jgi:uncharacterized protein
VGSLRALVDTGALFAAADTHDAGHAESAALLESLPRPIVVPMLAVAEAAYLLETRLGTESEAKFVAELAAGALVAEPVAAGDWLRIVELIVRYRDLPLGTVDASIVAAAERLEITTLVTFDRRHFSVVRPRHVDAFELLP